MRLLITLLLLLCAASGYGQTGQQAAGDARPATGQTKRTPIPLPPIDDNVLKRIWGEDEKPAAAPQQAETRAAAAPRRITPPQRSRVRSAARPARRQDLVVPDPPSPQPPPEANYGRPSAIPLPTYEPAPSQNFSPTPRPEPVGLGTLPEVQLGFADESQSEYVGNFVNRASQILDDDNDPFGDLQELPAQYAPWWSEDMYQPLRPRYAPLEITLESIIISALTHSPKVQALKLEPAIRQKSVAVESAEFDWLSFIETSWDDTSDPVGNTLTTGGAPRFRENIFSFEGGLRKRTLSGGQFEISETLGWQDNNSNFFVPAPQGSSRLELSFTQPLLRQRGVFYNQSRIVQATLDSQISDSETLTSLQDHLVEVAQAYWELFRARAAFLQRRRLLTNATRILTRLEGRRGVDVLQRQILRARAAVATRRSEIARAAASVKNAEARLRLLVNDPALTSGNAVELIPAESPLSRRVDYSTADTVTVGLLTRPDIAAAIRNIRLQSVRYGVARNEILPKLDLILSTYWAGLRGDGNIWGSISQRTQDGDPGYGVGLNFEFPLGNRAAKATAEQQRFRMRKAMFEFRDQVETTITEIELAVREAKTSYAEMSARYQAMQASQSEAEYLDQRWRELPGDDRSTSELLEDLLDAQDRVTSEETEFETARRNYMLALTEVKRVTGTLLSSADGRSRLKQSGSLPVPEMQATPAFPTDTYTLPTPQSSAIPLPPGSNYSAPTNERSSLGLGVPRNP